MLKQGEKIEFTGTFSEKIGDSTWSPISDLSLYTIIAKITNPKNNINITYKTGDSERPVNLDSSKSKYSFSISPKDTVKMVGECYCEIALVKDENVIISNDKVEFIIQDSLLGREITT